ncbi:MAG: hypothetical protein LBT18_02665 [Endomicrobium sp.]|jgi:hypothetical protein|nr:hypothetical protein [Endomicrobium sp.]
MNRKLIKATNFYLSFFFYVFYFMLAINVYAASGGAAFLKKGVGARALGMGGAYTSLSNDATAVYWNPAGLGQVKKYSISVMGTSGASNEWTGLQDVVSTHNFAAISIPISKFTNSLGGSVFALGLLNSSIGNIVKSKESDDGTDGIEIGKFSDTQNAIYLSWGMPIWESDNNLYAGLSLKYILESMDGIDGGKASGYDIDVGLVYNVFKTLNFGLLFNKGAKLTWEGGETDNAALTTKFGVSNKFTITDKFRITGAFDLIQSQKEPLSGNIGAEVSYLDIFTAGMFGLKGLHLRGGLNSYALEDRYGKKEDINKNVTYSIGFGIDLMLFESLLQLDYAMSMGNLFDQKNKISLNFFF